MSRLDLTLAIQESTHVEVDNIQPYPLGASHNLLLSLLWASQHHIVRLDISMYHLELMQEIDGRKHLLPYVLHDLQWNLAPLKSANKAFQRAALACLHHLIVIRFVLKHMQHPDYMRVLVVQQDFHNLAEGRFILLDVARLRPLFYDLSRKRLEGLRMEDLRDSAKAALTQDAPEIIEIANLARRLYFGDLAILAQLVANRNPNTG